MTDRDDELARRLDGVRPPDHGPHFWSSLRQGLVEDDGVVEIAEQPYRRRFPQGWLVAAAVVLVALVGAAVALSTDRDTDVATDPSVVVPPPETTLAEDGTTTTTTTPGAGPLRPDGEPIERGVGRPVALDPTGEFLYVAAPAPEGGLGCEGAPAEALYVERVDGDGSDRRLAADPALVDATGGIEVRFSARGEIAVVPRCEGFGNRVLTGRVAEDGTVSDLTELALRDIDLERDVDGISDLEFVGPGVLLAATWAVAADGSSEHRHLYEFPTSPSETSDLGIDGVVRIAVSPQGRVVTLSADGTIAVDGEPIATTDVVAELELTPSGAAAVTRSSDGLVVVDLDTGSIVAVPGTADAESPVVVLSDDDVIYGFAESASTYVHSATLSGPADAGPPIVVGRITGTIVASPSRVFVAGHPPDDAPDAATSVLLEQRLTR